MAGCSRLGSQFAAAGACFTPSGLPHPLQHFELAALPLQAGQEAAHRMRRPTSSFRDLQSASALPAQKCQHLSALGVSS
ncbi:hypothetical protein HMPREF9946_05230 [Acetobacteraceae bacterium AT-5844]|nr:hypothetical protein HMPREF9946_05230 [Acetobacteraceae bacterium AT-5844]